MKKKDKRIKAIISPSPMECRNVNDAALLQADNYSTKDAWIIVGDGEVTIMKQHEGDPPAEEITLPRRTFNALVRWYVKEQTKRAKL